MIENSLHNIPLDNLLESNTTTLFCTLGQVKTCDDDIVLEVERKSDYFQMDRRNRSLLSFFINDSESAVNTAIEIRKILSSENITNASISIHSEYILSVEDVNNMISICNTIDEISFNYGLSIGVSQMTFCRLPDPNIYNFRFTDKKDSIALFDFIDGEQQAVKSAKIESKSVFEDSVFNFYRSRYEEAVAGFRNSLLLNPDDKASFSYLKRADIELERDKNN